MRRISVSGIATTVLLLAACNSDRIAGPAGSTSTNNGVTAPVVTPPAVVPPADAPADTTATTVTDTTGTGTTVVDTTTTTPPTTPTSPDGNPDTTYVADLSAYALSATGTFAVSGTATAVEYSSSGPALRGRGSCTGDAALGTEGTWINPGGNVTHARHAHCVQYASDGRVGNYGTGTCVTAANGYPGALLAADGTLSAGYNIACVKLAATASPMNVTFADLFSVYTATNGSNQQLVTFPAGPNAGAQLNFHGNGYAYTSGAGMIVGGVDDGSPADATWAVELTQVPLNWGGNTYNGNQIAALQSTGVDVIACSLTQGCRVVSMRMAM